MPSAEIIAIGTELLLGEILDTNTQFLAKELNKAGIDIYRTMIIGDNPKRIQQAIQEILSRSEIVITTGGLGPTIDDPTRKAAANATDSKLIFQPKLWRQIKKQFEKYGRKASENNRRQAYLPQNAMPIENPVGTAPAFYIEINEKVLICLPGVPAEMQHLFLKTVLPFLCKKYSLNQVIHSVIIHTAGIGESMVDEQIGDLETMQNPTVGLTAHPGLVDIRVTAKAKSLNEAMKIIDPIVQDLYKRLGNNIFGLGEITIQDLIKNFKEKNRSEIVLVLSKEWSVIGNELKEFHIVDQVEHSSCEPGELEKLVQKIYNGCHKITAGINLTRTTDRISLKMVFCSQKGCVTETRFFAGHPSLTHEWVKNIFLNFLRCNLS